MRRRRRPKKRSRWLDATTEEGRAAQRDAAFAAIRRLYCELLPLWRTCSRGHCRRHHACRVAGGEDRDCLRRTWPLMPRELQQRAFDLAKRGGPRRIPAATRRECELRQFPPTNFVL